MAIAFRAVGTVSKTTSGNMAAVVLPTGHVANDILVLCVAANDNVASTVTGWTLKSAVNNGTTCRSEIWWIRDNGAVSAPTVTRTSGKDACAFITAYSGVDTGLADPFRDSQSTTGISGASPATFVVTAAALTGVVAGDFRGFFGTYTDATHTDGSSVNMWSTVTSFTERVDAVEDLGAGTTSVGYDDLLAAGAAGSITSTATYGGTSTTGVSWIGWQFALSSAVSAAVTVPPLPTVVGFAVARSFNY